MELCGEIQTASRLYEKIPDLITIVGDTPPGVSPTAGIKFTFQAKKGETAKMDSMKMARYLWGFKEIALREVNGAPVFFLSLEAELIFVFRGILGREAISN